MSSASETDSRTTAELLTQWRKLSEIKRDLTKAGIINGDATPAEILTALRQTIPPNIFDDAT